MLGSPAVPDSIYQRGEFNLYVKVQLRTKWMFLSKGEEFLEEL